MHSDDYISYLMTRSTRVKPEVKLEVKSEVKLGFPLEIRNEITQDDIRDGTFASRKSDFGPTGDRSPTDVIDAIACKGA